MSDSYFIGITGGSASGKTTLIHTLRQQFEPEHLSWVSQDNYYHSAEQQPVDENGHTNFDLPHCLDMGSFIEDLQTLRKGQAIRRKEYLYQNKLRESAWIETHPAPVILVDGLFLLHEIRVHQLLDYRVFVETDKEMMLQRRVERDTRERGVTREVVEYQWRNHVLPSYQTYLEPFKHQSDLIIFNNEGFDASLKPIINLIKQKLKL